MLPTSDVLTNAFQLLSVTVRDFYSAGRPCLGATLKPELYRRSRNDFSEQQLGFPRFGDFLRAAQAGGYIQLTSTPGGDVAAWPMGVRVSTLAPRSNPWSSSPARSALASNQTVRDWSLSSSRSPVRVRQDLWNAFNSFYATWVYDPAADIAFRESQAARVADEQMSFGPVRPDLVKIPSGRDRVVEWMRSFANTQDAGIKEKLSAALDCEDAPYQFNNLVRSDSKLWSAWRRYHVQQILAAIEAWATSNSIHPRGVTGSLYLPVRSHQLQTTIPTSQDNPTGAQMPAPAPQPKAPASPALANRLEALIDELIDELVKLRGFLQFVPPR